jgi:hypothetical protein
MLRSNWLYLVIALALVAVPLWMWSGAPQGGPAGHYVEKQERPGTGYSYRTRRPAASPQSSTYDFNFIASLCGVISFGVQCIIWGANVVRWASNR